MCQYKTHPSQGTISLLHLQIYLPQAMPISQTALHQVVWSPVPQPPHLWVRGGNTPLLRKPLCIWEVAQRPLVLETLQNSDYWIQEYRCFALANYLLITTVMAIKYCPQQLLRFSTNNDKPSQNFCLNPSARLPALVTRFLTISAFNSCSTD